LLADARRDLGRIEEVVPGASGVTRRLAEVLYLIRELTYIPRNRRQSGTIPGRNAPMTTSRLW